MPLNSGRGKGSDASAAALRALGQLLTRGTAGIDRGQLEAALAVSLHHGLAPVALRAVEGVAVEATLRERLEAARRRAVVAWMARWRAVQEVDRLLAAAGVPRRWLKGVVLALQVYESPWERPMSDVDVLVPPAQADRAVACLRAAGWRERAPDGRPHDGGDPVFDALSLHWALVNDAYPGVLVELHRRLLSADDRLMRASDLAAFFAEGEEVEGPGGRLTAPEAALHQAYLCAHAALQHGAASRYLQRFYDVHRLIECGRCDEAALVERAIELRWAGAVRVVLGTCVDLFQTPVDPATLRRLQRDRSPEDLDGELAAALDGRSWRLRLLLRTWRALPPRGRVQYLSNLLCPPGAWMRRRYGLDGRATLWPWYIRRWVVGLGHLVRGLVGLTRGRRSGGTRDRPGDNR